MEAKVEDLHRIMRVQHFVVCPPPTKYLTIKRFMRRKQDVIQYFEVIHQMRNIFCGATVVQYVNRLFQPSDFANPKQIQRLCTMRATVGDKIKTESF